MNQKLIKKIIQRTLLIALLLFCVPALFVFLKNFAVNYLWFQSLGYTHRFLLVFKVKILTFLFFFLISFLIIILNHIITKYNIKNYIKKLNISSEIWAFNNKVSFLFLLLFAIIFGLTTTFWWEEILNFINAIKFEKADPVFNFDIGFYVFKFELYKVFRLWFFSLFVLLFLWTMIYYYFTGSISFVRFSIFTPQKIRAHLGTLFFIIFINYTFKILFNKYELLFNQSGIIKGASFTDTYFRVLAYNILIISLVINGLSFFYWVIKNKLKIPIFTIIGTIVVFSIFNGLIPVIVQNFWVSPDEIEKERPFIKNTIKYTRDAYHLNNIQAINFEVKNDLHLKPSIDKNIINNIRLWDWRPLKATFKQLQEIRPYYIFSDVDVDRYIINGRLREVMLSAREISHSNLPREARNWINRYLKYTHGHGIVMMPVNIKNDEGLPIFFIKDIPPQSDIDIEIRQPEIYYGETVRDYVIVNTKTKEFDYPSRDGNAYTSYTGSGGILIDSYWKKLSLSIELSDIKMILSGLITKKTRVMIRRNIIDIVKRLVPFLAIDNDPYIVVINGKLYWFIDAYTYTDKYPYSEMHAGQYNYIRNSVKIIINAYTGKTDLYISEKNDPIIKVYQKIFPNLFKEMDTLPLEFKKHFRYPDNLFMAQAEIYRSYHMTDPEVFFNKEDLWDIPVELYDNTEVLMSSYFVINKIKGEENLEFLNMIPFTPAKKDNMIGLLMARCDIPNYGKLVVYKLSKKKLIYGPKQIESLIDQNVEISKLITLWGQKGSRVVRGNLFVIPIEDSIIYVEPLFIIAETAELPELKRIIVVYNNNVAIAPSLDEALDMVIKGRSSSIRLSDEMRNEMIRKLNLLIQKTEKSIMNKDFKSSKNNIQQLKKVIGEYK